MRPLVSVVMPCFNADKYIHSAITSIINQTFTDWELIIVDDASLDRSISIIESFNDSRINLLKQDVNRGYPFAMNIGIEAAQGDYIARMDADDICLPLRFEEQLNELHENPSASFCGTNRFRITPGGKMYIDKKKWDANIKWETWDDLMSGKRIFTDASVIIKRNTVLKVGGYRTYQRSGMDVDLWLRVMEKFGPGITLMKPLYGRTIDPNSLVFNPKTHINNQIPRLLAEQRSKVGLDDLQLGKTFDPEKYKKQALVTFQHSENKSGLLFGSLVTCLWLKDWNGAGIYYRQIRSTRNLSLVKIIFMVIKKILQRLRSNPYVRYKLPV